MWFTYLLLAMLLGDLWWWYYAARAVRRAKLRPWARWMVHVFMGFISFGMLLLWTARFIPYGFDVVGPWTYVILFVWHFMLLPLVLVPSLIERLAASVVRLVSKKEKTESPETAPPDLSRRAFLTSIIVVAPPAATLALTGKAAVDQDQLEVRKIDLPLPNLPPALDGLKIAHVTDPHIGSFMTDHKYRSISEMVNAMDADLVLHGGDLINHNIKDLPDGIQLLRQMRGKYGVFSCQGNHDKIGDAAKFERDTVAADVGMLLDQTQTLRVNGQKIQLIAPRWVSGDDRVVRWTVEQLLPQRDPDAFAILMAHHPHAFDAAADANIPLTLSGHTHGGQIRLAGNIGFGPLMYRYWSGAYRNGDSASVVSVGVGNWFPVRINVPCEIIELTLRRM